MRQPISNRRNLGPGRDKRQRRGQQQSVDAIGEVAVNVSHRLRRSFPHFYRCAFCKVITCEV